MLRLITEAVIQTHLDNNFHQFSKFEKGGQKFSKILTAP